MIDPVKIGCYIQEKRKQAGLTQAEMGERLGVSFQSVSNWERGESLPDTALLLDLAQILDTSVDAILGGGTLRRYRRKITVAQMRSAIDCVRSLCDILGREHFMYRAMVDGLDRRMNSAIEATFGNDGVFDAYVCEAMIECVKNGDYVDINDIKDNIKNEKAKAYTLDFLAKQGIR